jgi:hypothetical protein
LEVGSKVPEQQRNPDGLIKCFNGPDMVINTCKSSTHKAEAGGLQVWGQPGLHSETLSQKNISMISLHFLGRAGD